MSSSCIPTGLRLDLDMVKAAASPGAHSSPLRPVHSSPSSTLSEASNASSSATSVSLKRARAPRKRPNQAYNEAAALLASIHPSVFPVKKSPKTGPPRPPSRQLSGLAAAFDASSDLLPLLPVLADSAFLLRDMPAPSPSPQPQPQPQSPSSAKNCSSPAPVSSAFRDFRDPAPSPASPDTVDVDELGEIDFDAESILDVDEAAAGAAAEGLDGIMGSIAVESNNTATTSDDSILSSSGIHPYLRSLMVVGLAGRFELGLGFRHGARPNLNRALKRRDDDGAWWMWPAVPVKDLTIAPPTPPAPPASNAAMPQATAAPEKKKSKKKKVVKVEKIMAKGKEELPNAKCKEEADGSVDTANGDGDADSAPTKAPKTGLGLKLDADEVLKAWSDKGSMFAEGSGPESPTSAAEVRAKLADIDLFPENGAGGGIREASVLRYKEKRRTRLFSKKIRYQVRKVNADCRPRMKGRFVRSPSLLQQALEEES
ncbi:protein CHLOROPLAST IMPORT APPARATUS 2 isoform X1 [Miscanthus floridulus]|uniref:protein CHLOROPLAST IMPORT APPARATUS 2 isoform X1 n=1 Tax=Miscanthus floridulus TaxID=154761 RepID=UPI0034588EF1